ncbi:MULTISPECIES: hypothetical protein [Actinoalloteichus]|uniref:Aminoglycoside phosphotransferase n=1 Tax=Actinoalloteichus fjordicus TaxID=1612552 RepID=A0AAC9PQR1_9PSEU|nr:MULTISPECIES: hypothetical protein [Actinoalloteichus]APU13192.1 hypothetical protein UA74_05580 [Actinoalloteichus fjordicus]APU19143.1 hypothetical protein UA75_05585 [Actinoalloteichus sp. GBA129-24]
MDLTETVAAEVERRLDVRLDRSTSATGAWAESAGHRTDRGTWVRVTSRGTGWIQPQSWVGAEAASVISGVPKPGWVQSATWRDPDGTTVWRAEEMELVGESVIATGGATLAADPGLPDAWWAELRAALTALGGFTTFRVSGRQELITRRISQVLGEDVHQIDTTVTDWTTSHGDLHWGNLTGPRLVILDWTDWGLAPRGNDAACLWATALAVPAVADRVLAEFAADLDTRSGRIARLWVTCNLLRLAATRADAHPLAEPARKAAGELIIDLS